MNALSLPKEFHGYTVVETQGMNHVVANLIKGNVTVQMVRYANNPNAYHFTKGLKQATIKGIKAIEIREDGRIWEFEQ